MAVDDSSNVILTGYAYGTDFGGGPLPSVVGTIFLAKFDPAGAHVWSQAFPLANTEYYTAIVAVDLSGNVYLTGTFKEGIDLGGEIFWTWYDYEYDMYLAKYDPTGAHVWSERFRDSDVMRGSDQNGESIALDPFGYIFVVGQPGSTPDFGGGGLATGASPFVVKFGPTGTAVTEESIRYQSGIDAYPNPFNPSTTITYSTSQSGAVRLAVYDARGRLVSTLVDDFQIAGDHKVTWDGRDANDTSVASGVYFVWLESIGQVQTHKITLIE